MKGSEMRLWHIVGQGGTVIAMAGFAAWLLLPAYILAATIVLFAGIVIVTWALYEIGEVHAKELTVEHAWRKEHGLEGDARR